MPDLPGKCTDNFVNNADIAGKKQAVREFFLKNDTKIGGRPQKFLRKISAASALQLPRTPVQRAIYGPVKTVLFRCCRCLHTFYAENSSPIYGYTSRMIWKIWSWLPTKIRCCFRRQPIVSTFKPVQFFIEGVAQGPCLSPGDRGRGLLFCLCGGVVSLQQILPVFSVYFLF